MIKYAYQLNDQQIIVEKDNGNETKYGTLKGYTSTGITYQYENKIFYETLQDDALLVIKETRIIY